jgi:casein kinase 1
MQMAATKHFTGTLRYAPIAPHFGFESCRRDELESLLYNFIFFLKGKLPWQGMSSKDSRIEIGEAKTSISGEDLCKGL